MPVNSNTGDRIPTPVVEATEQCSSRAATGRNPAIEASGPKSLPPNVFRDKTIDAEQRSGTPVKQVAAVAAEVADTAAKLDSVSAFGPSDSKRSVYPDIHTDRSVAYPQAIAPGAATG